MNSLEEHNGADGKESQENIGNECHSIRVVVAAACALSSVPFASSNSIGTYRLDAEILVGELLASIFALAVLIVAAGA